MIIICFLLQTYQDGKIAFSSPQNIGDGVDEYSQTSIIPICEFSVVDAGSAIDKISKALDDGAVNSPPSKEIFPIRASPSPLRKVSTRSSSPCRSEDIGDHVPHRRLVLCCGLEKDTNLAPNKDGNVLNIAHSELTKVGDKLLENEDKRDPKHTSVLHCGNDMTRTTLNVYEVLF